MNKHLQIFLIKKSIYNFDQIDTFYINKMKVSDHYCTSIFVLKKFIIIDLRNLKL